MSDSFAWLGGGGTMGQRVRSFDWAETSLGPVETWPAELRSAASLVLESAFPSALIWGSDLVTLYNDAFLPILGDKPDALGRSCADIWSEIWPEISPLVDKAFAGESTFIEDFPLQVKRGEEPERAWFTFSYSPVRGSDGSVLGMIDTVIETTRAVQDRERAQRSEVRLAAVFEALPVGIAYVGLDGQIALSNKEMQRYLPNGTIPSSDPVGPSLWQGWHEDGRRLDPDDFPGARAMRGERVVPGVDMLYTRPSGHKTWVNVAATPLREGGGSVTGELVVVGDVTAAREGDARQTFLLKLSDALRPIADALCIQSQAARLLGEYLDVDRCGYCDVDESATWITCHRDYRAAGMQSFVGTYPLDEFGKGVVDPLRNGRTVVIDDNKAHPASADPVVAQAFASADVRGSVGVPFVKQGVLRAIFFAHQRQPRRWTKADVALIEDVADRTWAAVAQSRAEEARRNVEERFRTVVESLDSVFYMTDLEQGRLEFLSPAFQKIWGRSPDELMADLSVFETSIHPDDRELFAYNKAAQLRGEPVLAEYRIIRPDGEIRWIEDRSFPVAGAEGRRSAGIASDVTNRHSQDRALVVSDERLHLLVAGIPQLVWRAGEPAQWTWASPQWTDYTGQTIEESMGLGWLQAVHPDDQAATLHAWEKASERQAFEAEYRICNARSGRYCWFQTRATPVRGPDGSIVEWLGTSTDVDELRGLQQRQQMLLAELQHRVRNTLGIIKTIARRTAETSDSTDEMAAHLQGRLDAFSRVQAAVTRDPSGGVELTGLIEDELLAHATREGPQFGLHGPRLMLQPRAAESMSLAIHELATNAVKHGALANGHGRVDVRWRVEDERFEFSWKEFGPEIPEPEPGGEGFGMELLLRSLPYDLNAKTDIAFEPGTVRFTLSAPTEGLIAP